MVGIPGKIVWHEGKKIDSASSEIDLEHNDLPDPVAEMMLCMQRNMNRLEQRIAQLEKELKKNVNQSI